MINIDEFKLLAKEELKIDLLSYKDDQLNRRLKAFFTKNDIKNASDYVNTLKNNKSKMEEFLDFVTINVTEFFRNPELFNELKEVIKAKNLTKLRIWSAACSNGCEAYSMAILLNEMNIKNFSIIGTDLDPNIIRKAREGIYEDFEIKNLSKELVDKYFIRIGDKYRFKEEYKSQIKFKTHDLLVDRFEKDFDIIVCRNVVIYFNAEAKITLYKKISKSLKQNGMLFVGATENIHEYSDYGLGKISSFIYYRK